MDVFANITAADWWWSAGHAQAGGKAAQGDTPHLSSATSVIGDDGDTTEPGRATGDSDQELRIRQDRQSVLLALGRSWGALPVILY